MYVHRYGASCEMQECVLTLHLCGGVHSLDIDKYMVAAGVQFYAIDTSVADIYVGHIYIKIN